MDAAVPDGNVYFSELLFFFNIAKQVAIIILSLSTLQTLWFQPILTSLSVATGNRNHITRL